MMDYTPGITTSIWLQSVLAISVLSSLYFASKSRSNFFCAFLAIVSLANFLHFVPNLVGLLSEKSVSSSQWYGMVFAAMVFALLGWENFAPRSRYQWSSRQFRKSVAYIYLWLISYPLFNNYILIPIRDLVPRLWSLNQHVPVWAQVTIFILVLSLKQYWFHRACHYFDFAWRFHKIHHAVKEVNVFAKFQASPVEYYLGQLGNLLSVMFLTFSPPILLAHLVHLFIKGPFAYANIDFPRLGGKIPFWAYIIKTPNFHAHHHTSIGMRSNFGTGLMIWDWLFGTLETPIVTPKMFGVGSTEYSEKGILADQIAPFLSQSRYKDDPPAQTVVESIESLRPRVGMTRAK
jgi:sterol desaturase/sphingolipid hydroxylase (fatty acid hydroxylase superfamily)